MLSTNAATASDHRAKSLPSSGAIQSAMGMDALLLIGAASGDVIQSHICTRGIRPSSPFGGELSARRSQRSIRNWTLSCGKNNSNPPTGPSTVHIHRFLGRPDRDAGLCKNMSVHRAADPVSLTLSLSLQGHHRTGTKREISSLPRSSSSAGCSRGAGCPSRYRLRQDKYQRETLPEHRRRQFRNGNHTATVISHDIYPGAGAPARPRKLGPEVDLIIVNYAQPYGIRILGQRFVAYYGWDAETQLRIAAHEIFHPPFDKNDAELITLLADLRDDSWMMSIVNDHDPQFGYNSFEGVVDEGSTQALDQIVSDRLGFAQDPGERWRESDGGMHMFAAALYQAMRESGDLL